MVRLSVTLARLVRRCAILVGIAGIAFAVGLLGVEAASSHADAIADEVVAWIRRLA